MPPEITGWIIGGLAGLLFIAIETAMLAKLFHVPLPHHLLVISGRSYHRGGQVRGFRVERKLTPVMPIVEQVLEMDASCSPCRIEVRGAFLQGGGAAAVELFALVRVSADPQRVYEAVERFMGMPADTAARVATETLEGETRGLMATLTAAEVEAPAFLDGLVSRSEESFRKLGLDLVHVSLESFRKEA